LRLRNIASLARSLAALSAIGCRVKW
jgi:hypothetical protein